MKKAVILITLLFLLGCANTTDEAFSKDHFEDYVIEHHGENYVDTYLRHQLLLKEIDMTEEELKTYAKEQKQSIDEAMWQLASERYKDDLVIDFSREYYVLVGKYEGEPSEQIKEEIQKDGITSEHLHEILVLDLGEIIEGDVVAEYDTEAEVSDGFIITNKPLSETSDEFEKSLILQAKIKDMVESEDWLNEKLSQYEIEPDELLN